MIYFFSYGDDKYKNSKDRIRNEAQNFIFDKVDIYGREDIPLEFIEKTKPYIDIPRGGGYWLWKPFFLKKTFEMMSDGDVCVYADAGCTINPHGKNRFEEYLSLIDKDENESGILRFICGPKEELFTNQMVFEHFGKGDDTEFKSKYHLMATIMVFKKNENSKDFVEKYYNLAIEHPILFSDHYNEYNKNQDYRDHRHDQSISSCLVNLSGKGVIIEDETYAPDMDGWRNLIFERKVPFLATRIRI
jgi:hypothetical protein